jgi:phage terminase small subunit
MDEIKLTTRQRKAIPLIVSGHTYTEGCEKAKINKTTFYKWLKEPDFKAEFDRQRNEITDEAFAILSQNLTKAVETLTGLMDTQDNRLKRLVCNDIIEHILQHREIEEINNRLTAIEQRLAEKT